MDFIGIAAIFLVASFVQCNFVLNRGALASYMWLAAFIASVYYYSWYGAGAFIIGAMVGSNLAFNSMKEQQ